MSEVAHQLQFLFHGGRKRKHGAVPLPNLQDTPLLHHNCKLLSQLLQYQVQTTFQALEPKKYFKALK